MDDYQKYTIVLNNDVQKHAVNDKVCVTGIVNRKWKRPDGGFGIQIQDLSGSVNISFATNNYRYAKEHFIKGKRVRLYASVAIDNKNEKYLHDIVDVEFLEELNRWTREYDIIEQESLVLISKICNKIRARLTDINFIEVNTRIISRYIGDEILEPLLADYPGYGSPAYLAPSPSSQLSEFLAVTLLPRVFTETVSITSSYRFPNGATEIPIIMAKAINLSSTEEKEIILKTSSSIMSSLSDRKYKLKIVEDEWGNEAIRNNPYEKDLFIYCTYSSNIPAIGKRWSSVVNTIHRLEDDNGNLLVESAVETVNESIKISTITFYPTQYLNWIKKAPKRQLLNLWQLYGGGNIYV